MALIKIADWVAETTNTIGTGDVQLTGQIVGFSPFSEIGDGKVYYTIQEGFDKEVGIGTLDASNSVLKRTQVIATIINNKYSTNATPMNLNGFGEVYCTISSHLINGIIDHIESSEKSISDIEKELAKITGDLSGFVTHDELASHPASAIPTSISGVSVQESLDSKATKEDITKSQGDIIGGSIFKGSNGETVKVGDVVEPGITHLRVLVGGKPTIVAMSPIISGTVSSINKAGAIIDGVFVGFTQSNNLEFFNAGDKSAVDNMIERFNLNPLSHAIGTQISTGSIVFEFIDSTGPITEENFRATTAIHSRDFGVKSDGVTDDTANLTKAFNFALLSGGGTVLVSSGETVISNLIVPVGITLLGLGGEPSPFGIYSFQDPSIGQYDVVSRGATIFKVLAGSNGIICPETSTRAGTRLENFAIEGPEEGGSQYGLQMHQTSTSTKNVTVNRFPDGVGVEIGKSWRATHYMLQIRNCGLGMHLNGNIGAINGVSWYGLLIEECAAGLYHEGAPGGLASIANSFISPVIEAIRIRAGLQWPSHVTLSQQVKDDTGYTEENFTAGIVIDSDAGFNFQSLYTEAITGPHLWLGENSKVSLTGGICEFDLNSVETYTGPKFDVYRGMATFNSVRFVYDPTRNPNTAIFRVNEFTDFIFMGNKFSADRSVKEYYVDGYGSTLTYTNGYYQEKNGQPIALRPSDATYGTIQAETLITEQHYHTPTQSNQNRTFELDTEVEPQRLIVTSIFDDNSYTTTVNYTDVSSVKIGTRLTVIHKIFSASGATSEVTMDWGANLRGNPYTVTDSNVYVITEFTFTEGGFTQVSQSQVAQ